MPGYNHLDRSERDKIAELRAQGLGFKSPAEAFLNALGKDLTIRFNTPVALRG